MAKKKKRKDKISEKNLRKSSKAYLKGATPVTKETRIDEQQEAGEGQG